MIERLMSFLGFDLYWSVVWSDGSSSGMPGASSEAEAEAEAERLKVELGDPMMNFWQGNSINRHIMWVKKSYWRRPTK